MTVDLTRAQWMMIRTAVCLREEAHLENEERSESRKWRHILTKVDDALDALEDQESL